MAKMNIQECVRSINNREGGLIRLTYVEDSFGSPIRVSIRFRDTEFSVDKINWNDFIEDVAEISSLYAFVSSSEKMFHEGIIEIELKLIIYRKESEAAAEAISYIRRTLNQYKKTKI